MSNEPQELKPDASLNPALKSRVETTYDTSHSSAAPVETASVQREEGRAWPMIWLAVTVVCVLIVVYLVV